MPKSAQLVSSFYSISIKQNDIDVEERMKLLEKFINDLLQVDSFNKSQIL